jgi:16S rRNA processing protein RimM
VIVGRIVKPHGVQGAFRVALETDFPEHLLALRSAVLLRGADVLSIDLEEVRLLAGGALVRTRQIGSLDEAEKWRGGALAVPRGEAAQLSEGRHYVFDVLGMVVETDQGERLGRVAEVLRTGSNDVYVVRGDGGELLVPAISSVVLALDVAENRMVVHLLAGMRSEAR